MNSNQPLDPEAVIKQAIAVLPDDDLRRRLLLILRDYRFIPTTAAPIPPELREWAKQQADSITDEQLLDGIKEIQEQGARELGEVIQTLKRKRIDRGDSQS
jgi:hypothetical protein